MSRYQFSPDDPTIGTTTASTFGGPDDALDNGEFSFGGKSNMDGEINPEFYAAFPSEMYSKGVVKPGGVYNVTNPKTGVTIPVVARDKGPSAKNRGLDLAPHAMEQLGADTDQQLQVDFKPLGEAPVVGTGPGVASMQAARQHLALQGIDESSLSLGSPVAPSGLQSTGRLASVLSPINDATEGGGIDPDTGEPVDPAEAELVSGILGEDKQDGPSNSSNGSFVPTALIGSKNPKPVKTNPDGTVTFDDGVTYNPKDGSLMKGGFVFTQGPDGKVDKRVAAKEPQPHPIMIKDENGNSSPYVMKDGKLVRVPIDGEVSDQNANIPDGAIGDEAIRGLSPSDQAKVKGYASYDLPGPVAGRPNPLFNKLYPYIKAYNPNYSVTDFKTAQQLKMEYNSSRPGVAGGQITSINTAIDHLGQLWDAAQKLDNSKIRKYNSIQQYIQTESGNPDVVAYNSKLSEVNKEIERAFLGGVPTSMNQKEGMASLSSANSPEQLKTVITQALPELLSARLGEIGFNYEKFFGKPFQGLVRPTAKSTLDKFGVKNFGGQTDPNAPKDEVKDALSAPSPDHVANKAVEDALRIHNDPNAPQKVKEMSDSVLRRAGVIK